MERQLRCMLARDDRIIQELLSAKALSNYLIIELSH
jgi:hypothetical protein